MNSQDMRQLDELIDEMKRIFSQNRFWVMSKVLSHELSERRKNRDRTIARERNPIKRPQTAQTRAIIAKGTRHVKACVAVRIDADIVVV